MRSMQEKKGGGGGNQVRLEERDVGYVSVNCAGDCEMVNTEIRVCRSGCRWLLSDVRLFS